MYTWWQNNYLIKITWLSNNPELVGVALLVTDPWCANSNLLKSPLICQTPTLEYNKFSIKHPIFMIVLDYIAIKTWGILTILKEGHE